MKNTCPELLSLFDLMIDIALKDMADAAQKPLAQQDELEELAEAA